MGQELDRILAIPRRKQGVIGDLHPLVAKWSPLLLPAQIEALNELANMPHPCGLFGDIPVGGGKFLISMLAATVLRARRAVLLVPPDLVGQTKREWFGDPRRGIQPWGQFFPEAANHVPTIVSYGRLSGTKNDKILYELLPDVIISDEAHALCSTDSARTARWMNYVIDNPGTRVVVLSGTLDRPKIEDYAHLAEAALRNGTFLPLDDTILAMWASVLNHKAQPGENAKSALDPLVDWAKTNRDRNPYLAAFRERKNSTPGVIAPTGTGPGMSLYLRQWRPPTPKVVDEALKQLAKTWTLPDGSELVDALAYHRHSNTLSLGFYYKQSICGDADRYEEWREARLMWSRALRRQITYIARAGIDSPARVVLAIRQGRAHKDVAAAYWRWFKICDVVRIESDPVWLDKSIVLSAIDKVKQEDRSILWYTSARALEPVFRSARLPVFGAGTEPPEGKIKHAALSINTHGTGKNLQAWSRQLVLEPPSSGRSWEQLLGRTHRRGQLADDVICDYSAHEWPLRANMHAARLYAEYVANTSGKQQKLLIARHLT